MPSGSKSKSNLSCIICVWGCLFPIVRKRPTRRLKPSSVWLAALLTVAATVGEARCQQTNVPNPEQVASATSNLTLGEAVSRALRDSPALSASSLEVDAREFRAVQEGSFPNPVVRFEVENVAGSGVYDGTRSAQSTVFITQLFETAGKRVRRLAAARGEQEVAVRELGIDRLETVARTTKAFVAALAIQERLSLSEQLLESAGKSVALARQRVAAGSGSRVEPLRAEVQLRQVEANRARLLREAEGAYAALAANWGQSGPVAFTVRGEFYDIRPPKTVDEFLKLVPNVEDVRRSKADVALRDSVVHLEEARAIPDLTAGVGGRRFADEDEQALVVELSMPLPIFNRNRGGIEEAVRRRQKARMDLAKAVAEATASLRVAHAALSGSYSEALTLREETIPKAELALRGAEDGYRRGIFRALDVLDARRTLYEVRSQYIDALASYHAAQADVDRWTALWPPKPEPINGENQ